VPQELPCGIRRRALGKRLGKIEGALERALFAVDLFLQLQDGI
jgi:hypothetical protein